MYNQHHHVLTENKSQERENNRDEIFYPHSSNVHIYNQNGKDFFNSKVHKIYETKFTLKIQIFLYQNNRILFILKKKTPY